MGKCISRILFMPPQRLHEEADSDLTVPTAHNVNIQIKEIIKDPKALYLILSHGNAEDVYSVNEWAQSSLSQFVNVNIIMYEYTGYNMQDDVQCCEKFVYEDIEAVYNYITVTRNVSPDKIIAYGRSVGSGPSCYLAEKYPIGGLIINCGFMSVYRVIFKFRFTLPGDMFPNIDRMKNIQCPVCVFHSIKDEIVPFYHGKELYKAARNKFDPLFIDGTTHNNIDKLSDDVFKHMEKFFKFIDSNYKEVNMLNDNQKIDIV